MPLKHFVLYLGDAPSLLTVKALSRAGGHVPFDKPPEFRVGRSGVVDARWYDAGDGNEGLVLTPTAVGESGVRIEERVKDAEGHVVTAARDEIFVEVRPADGHTLALSIGAPDVSLVPPTAEQVAAQAAGKVDPNNPPVVLSPERAAKADALRRSMAKAAGLPETAGFDEIEDAMAKEGSTIVLEPGKKLGDGGDDPSKPQG